MFDLDNFKRLVIKGGMQLIIRQLIGLVLSIVSLIIIFKYLGPKNFGYISITQGIWSYISLISTLGIDIFFIRSSRDFHKEDINQLFTVIVTISFFILIISFPFANLIGSWIGDDKIIDLFRVYSLFFFVKQIGILPQAILDRNLRYKEISFIELLSQIIYYLVGIPLVIKGLNYWGVVFGYIASAVVTTSILFYLNPLKLNFKLNRNLLKESIKYGLSYQLAVWVWQLRDLTIPLIVSKIGGINAAGLLNGAMQLINRLSFFRTIIWRVSLSGLAKLQDNLELMRNSVNKGMIYQLIILGMIFLSFIFLSTLFVDLLGNRWEKIENIFPFLAVGVLFNATFSLYCSSLFVKGYNFAVNKFHIANVLLLWSFSILLTPVLGVFGYCIAELIALLSYFVLQKQTKRYLSMEAGSYILVTLLVFSLSMLINIIFSKVISIFMFFILLTSVLILFKDQTKIVINDLKSFYNVLIENKK